MSSHLGKLKKQAKESERRLLKYIQNMPECDVRAMPTDELQALIFDYTERVSFLSDKYTVI